MAVSAAPKAAPPPPGRPWLAVYFRCCHTYSRVYRNRQRNAYEGNCPQCSKTVKVGISPTGTSSRFFEAW